MNQRRGNFQGIDWINRHLDYDGDKCLIWPFRRDRHGYGCIGFRGRKTGAHRVMCILVCGEPPFARAEASHSCGNGHLGCVHPKHIRWRTPSENAADKKRHGTQIRGELAPLAKLERSDVEIIDRRLSAGESCAQIARDYGVTQPAISAIKRGVSWGWLTGR